MIDIIENRSLFNQQMIEWFHKNRRVLPWRETTNPYYILVSEIMLQQTQVITVIPYYLRFIEELPTLEMLANAPEQLLHKLWEGLGYYSRVNRLQQLARIVVDQYDGNIPSNQNELIQLPGIGPYTCGALLSFAFHQKATAIDGNVKRVIARIMASYDDIMKQSTSKWMTNVLSKQLPDDIYAFNQGLIELGALICKPKNPECEQCPLKSHCKAYALNIVHELPIKKKNAKQRIMKVPLIIIEDSQKLLFIKRSSSGLLSNQWGLPMIEEDISTDRMEEAIIHYLDEEFEINDELKIRYIGHVKHVFSHIIWEQYIYKVNSKNMIKKIAKIEQPEMTWAFQKDIALPTAFKKSIEIYESKR